MNTKKMDLDGLAFESLEKFEKELGMLIQKYKLNRAIRVNTTMITDMILNDLVYLKRVCMFKEKESKLNEVILKEKTIKIDIKDNPREKIQEAIQSIMDEIKNDTNGGIN